MIDDEDGVDEPVERDGGLLVGVFLWVEKAGGEGSWGKDLVDVESEVATRVATWMHQVMPMCKRL